MNRIIKFRALDKMGVWWFFTLDDLIKGNIAATTGVLTNWTQFTGLFDKNGKEIYEGDILSVGIGNDFGSINYDGGYVFYNERYCQFRIQRIGKGNGAQSSELSEMKDVKITGNIYENPELLK